MKTFEILKEAISSDSPTSSKRICGIIGWILCLLCVIYSVVTGIESPEIVYSLFIASTSLLGLDSIMNIFKRK